jgi:hypothetical protein
VFRRFAGMSPSDVRKSNDHLNGLNLAERIRCRASRTLAA